MEIEGGEDPVVRNVVFDSPGGNGLLLSGYIRDAVVEQNEFKWVGDSAIVLLGRTDPAQPCNGSNGEQPRGTQIVGNFIREVPILAIVFLTTDKLDCCTVITAAQVSYFWSR